MKKGTRQNRIRRRLVAMAVAACFAAEVAYANPVGPVVVNGQVTFARAGSLLSITNSPSSIINWQQFSIGAGETTRFIQQSAASAVLNRVVGADPSAILGALQSNGRVFLINPNGILFGAGARIDVAGLVASTLKLSNEDFIAGRLNFVGDPAKAAAVVNQGRITAGEGGGVYLIGSAVDNQGVITAPNGDVVLAAGSSVRVTESAGSRLQVEITAPADSTVNLSEAVYGSRGIYGGLVRNSGTISADSAVHTADGRIILKASKDVTLESTSVVSASGAKGGAITAQAEGGTLLVEGRVEATGSETKGGEIQLLGERVGLVSAAEVDGSGKTGGGTVLVGGDYQGKNPEIQNASRTYVGPDAIVRADAADSGDGGKVVVWADGDTRYYGSISARGGVSAGDGGLVEVSGKQYLDFHGKVDVSAPHGEGGKVLLDPQDIVLNTTTQPAPPNNAIGTPDVAFADPPAAGIYTIQIADVTGYSELFLQATNNITVSNALTMGAGNTIRFEADNNITINAAVTASGTPSTARPSITLTADADASGSGTVAINSALTSQQGGIVISGASVTSAAAGTIVTTGAASQNAGSLSITASGAVSLAGAITANGGAASGGVGRTGGAVTITGAGISTAAITASGTAGAAGFTGGAGGTIQLTSTNGMTAGALTASGGAAGAGSVSGGTGGTIVITNDAAGNIATGALTARAGAGTGTALSSPGLISVTNNAAGASLQTGAIDTRGNNNGAGGAVTLSSQGALQFGAAATILTSGGAALAGTAGQSGGVVTLTGATVTTTGAITTSGAAGSGANQAGGNAGAITVTASGALDVSAGTLTASGGNAGAGGAVGTGGNAGTISITNTSTSTGNIATGALTAVSGNAVGGGAAATAGSVTVTNDNATAGATLATGAINVSGGAKGGGGSVVLDSDSDLSVTGTIQASGGGAAAGGTHAGASGGTITLTGVNRSVSGTITASGGVGAGTDQAGGNAGTVLLTGTGTLTTAGITVSTGAATGVGAGGTAGSIMLSGSAVTSGALTTTGGANGAGGGVSATSSAGLLNVGAITASGGAANVGTSGNAAGTVTLTSADALTATTITASGSAGNGANQAGGAGGTIQLTSTNGMTAGALTASGGAAGAGSVSGGTGGTIVITNDAAGNIATGALTARAGAGTGTALSSPGLISVTNNAAGASLQTGAIDTRGNNNGAGGAVTLSSQGALQFGAAATILTSGGAALAGTAGQSGGVVTLTGATVTTTGAITTSGAAGSGANQAGGNAGAITVTASGALDVSAGTLTASGGNAGGGNADGGDGGNVNLDAGAAATITLASITTTGGNLAGTGTAGAGGSITAADAALLGTNTTITATGGSAGIGVGGNVSLSGTLDSAGASRTLTVNTNGATVFGGAVGGALALTSLTTNATGTTSLGGDVTTTGAQSYGDAVTLTGNATLTGTTPTFSSTVNGGGFDLALDFSGTTTINGANFSSINNLSTGNGGTTQLTGVITTAGAQSYGDAVTLTGATTLRTTAGGSVSAAGVVTATAGTLTLDTVSGAATLNNVANDFGTVAITSGGTVSLVDANAMTLAGANVDSIQAQTLSSNLSVSAAITATGAGDSIVLAAAGNFVNGVGAGALNSGPGRWLVYSTSPAGSTENGLVGAAGSALPRLYNRTYAGNPPASITEPGNHLIYSAQPALTVTPDNKSKVYGANDPAQTYVAVGYVSDDGVTDTASTAGLTGSFARAVGETVTAPGPTYAISQGTFASNAGYSISFIGGRTLTVTQKALTGTIANQTKVYGADDPALAGIGVTLGGVVNNPAIVTWNGNVAVDDTGNVTASLASLTRDPGELVSGSPYNINSGTLNALAGSAAGNYTASVSTAGNTLAITAKALTATVANQTKTYGDDDPALAGIAPILSGLVNRTVVSWDTSTPINDSALTSTTTDLTRVAGETVAGSTYNITGGTFTAPSANYSAPTLAGTPTLTINQAPLSFALTTPGQTKVYGADDPALAGIGVTLTGLVNNPAVVTWNGNVAVNDSAVTGTLTSLTRAVGETVAASPYAITAGAVTLSGSDANYAKSFDATNSPTLTVTPRALSGTIANQTKTYGASDPALGGIGVTLAGLVNNPAVVTWNGNVAVDDTASVTATLASLARVAGETVAAPGPIYAITGGTLNPLAGPAAGNYTASLSTVGNTLTIAPAALSIRADDASRAAGVPNPAFTATYSGLQLADTPASLAGALDFSTPATVSSPAGSYSITPFGQTSTNYTITYVNGTLTVSTTAIPLPVSSSTFVNPVIQATNFLLPDPYIVAYSTDESITALPPTAAGPADGAQSDAQFGEQPSHRIQSDWQCFRYAIFTKLPPRYCGLK